VALPYEVLTKCGRGDFALLTGIQPSAFSPFLEKIKIGMKADLNFLVGAKGLSRPKVFGLASLGSFAMLTGILPSAFRLRVEPSSRMF